MDQHHDIQCTEKKLKDECRNRKCMVILDWTSPFILSFQKRRSLVDKEKNNKTPYVAYSLQSYIEQAVMYLVGPPPKSLCYENFCEIFPLQLEPAERRSLGEDKVKHIMKQAFQKALSLKRRGPKEKWISDLKMKERIEKEREIANQKQGTLHSDDASGNNITDQPVEDENLPQVTSIESTSSDQVQEVDLPFRQSQTLKRTSESQLGNYEKKAKLIKENDALQGESGNLDSSSSISGDNAALNNKFLEVSVESNDREENQEEDAINPSLNPLILLKQADAAHNLLSESENVIKQFENNQVLEIHENCTYILSSGSITTEPIKPLDKPANNLFAILDCGKSISAESFDALKVLNDYLMNPVFYSPIDFHNMQTGSSESVSIEADEQFKQQKPELLVEGANIDESQAEDAIHSTLKAIWLKQAQTLSKNETMQLDNNLTDPIIDLAYHPISSSSMESLVNPEENLDEVSGSVECTLEESCDSDSDLYNYTPSRDFLSANDCCSIPTASLSSTKPSSIFTIQADEQFNLQELEVPFEIQNQEENKLKNSIDQALELLLNPAYAVQDQFLESQNEDTQSNSIEKPEAFLCADSDSAKSTSDESCDGAIEFKEYSIRRVLFSSPNSFHSRSTKSPPGTRPQFFPIQEVDDFEPKAVTQTTSDVLEIHNCYHYFGGKNMKKKRRNMKKLSHSKVKPSIITLD